MYVIRTKVGYIKVLNEYGEVEFKTDKKYGTRFDDKVEATLWKALYKDSIIENV